MKNLLKILMVLSVLLLFSGANLSAQENTSDEETIKVETLLLNVPVIVGDRDGRYLAGLKKENFYIVENGERRSVDFFADEAAPMNVAILIDTSFSTKPVIDDIKEAARDFIKILRPEDKAMIASFDNTTRVWSEFTSDQKKLKNAIGKIETGGGSIMYDAMYLLMKKHFAPLQGRKAIIVLTDGGVTGRGVSENILLNALSESDIMIYPLLFDPPLMNATKEVLESARKFSAARMNKFSLITGGKLFDSGKTNFKIAFQNIADELKKQYVIGFYPTENTRDATIKIGLRLDLKSFNPQSIVLRTKRVITLKSRSLQKNGKN